MLNEQELKELQKTAEKNPSVKKLLEFYLSAQEDGERKLSNAFNTMLCDYADHISENKLQNIEATELIKIKTATEIFKNLKSVTGGAKKEESKEDAPKSFLDQKANNNRK